MAEAAKKQVLVCGATGRQGGAVARHLAAKGFTVRALTRHPAADAASALKTQGIEVVGGDLDDATSLERVLKGVWGAFSVQTRANGVEVEEAQGKRFAEVAKAAGVEHFVYSSAGSVNRNTGVPHFESKARIEQAVRDQKFPSYTIMRPTYFMENLLNPMTLQGDKLVVGLQPTTVIQMIAVDDIGKFGALAFEKPTTFNGAEVDLAGDAVTFPEAAAILSAALKRNISFVQANIEDVRTKAGPEFAAMLEWLDRTGYNADIVGLERRWGLRPQTLTQWARKHA